MAATIALMSVTASEAIGIKQMIDLFLERGRTHHARFINHIGDTHFVLFVTYQLMVQLIVFLNFIR